MAWHWCTYLVDGHVQKRRPVLVSVLFGLPKFEREGPQAGVQQRLVGFRFDGNLGLFDRHVRRTVAGRGTAVGLSGQTATEVSE